MPCPAVWACVRLLQTDITLDVGVLCATVRVGKGYEVLEILFCIALHSPKSANLA